MPTDVQTSFLELSSKFDIDPAFDMLKGSDTTTSNLENIKFYAPKKFVVLNEAKAQSAS